MEIDFLIKGTGRDHVLMTSEFTVATDNRNYGYRSKADKTITNTPIRYRNAQKN